MRRPPSASSTASPASSARPSASAPPAADYDRIAGSYHLLERLAFGGVLQRARTAYLDLVPPNADVLALGEGDGRFASALLAARPDVRITVLDASDAMLDRARQRAVMSSRRARVRTVEADLRLHRPPPDSFDVVAALFVLDQFTDRERRRFLAPYVRALKPTGTWLHADFAVPDGGWTRLRARLWLAFLYGFFRAATGVSATQLEPVERSLRSVGLVPVARRTWSHGLVEAMAFRRAEAAGPVGL